MKHFERAFPFTINLEWMKLYIYCILFFVFNVIVACIFIVSVTKGGNIEKINNLLKPDDINQQISENSNLLDSRINNRVIINERTNYIFSQAMHFEEITRGLPNRIVKRWNFKYLPWIIIPPLLTGDQQEHPIMAISQFQQLERDESNKICKSHNDSYCQNPKKFISDYNSLDCTDPKFKCGPDKDFIVCNHPKYLKGTVDFVTDGTIDLKSFDCGWKSNHSDSLIDVDSNLYYEPNPVIYLPIPKGFLFQHFMDGVLPKLVQVEKLIGDKNIKILVEVLELIHPIVRKLLNRIGFDKDRILSTFDFRNNYRYFKSSMLIIPCNTPPIHPTLWRRGQYILKLPVVDPNYQSTDVSEYVVYLSRNRGKSGWERRVTNDKEVIMFLTNYFKNSKYKFTVFDPARYSTLDELFDFWSNVRVVIGPHGGAFQNIAFARSKLVMVEFQIDDISYLNTPVRFIMHRQGVMMGNLYYALLCKKVDNGMKVEIGDLEKLLDEVVQV